MTLCIAHRDGWIAADTRCTANNELSPFDVEAIKKVKKIPNIAVIGCAGDTGVFQRIEKSVWDATVDTIIQKLADSLKNTGMDAQLLVVTWRKELIFIANNGVCFPMKSHQQWWAIGSGRDFAKGWFSAMENHQWRITKEHAFSCIRDASRFDTCINSDIVYEDLRL